MNLDNFLDTMDQGALERLQAKITSRLTSDTKTAPNAPTDELDAIYEGVSRAVTLRGGRGIPFNRFLQSRDAKDLKDKSVWLTSYLRKYFKPANKVQFLYAACLVLGLLGEWLERARVPLSYRTMIRNMDRVPGLVEEAFPGYGSANLLPTVVARASKRKSE